MSKRPLEELSDQGQSVWIDSLSREMIESGELERLIREDSVVGVTTNPSIFQKAMASGHAYDEQMRDVLERQQDGKEVFLQSRDLKPLGRYFPELLENLKRVLPGMCVIDGETVIVTNNGLDFDDVFERGYRVDVSKAFRDN